MSMRLISEVTEDISTSIIEEAEGTKSTFIEGIFAQAELPNRNHRVYPKRVLESAIDSYQEMVKANRALGELNHPTTPTVDPERACIKIEKLTWDGNNVIGKARVLSTPKGKLLEALIRDKVQLGVSTRGLGSVHRTKFKNEDVSMVGDDYQIRAIDVVHNPSGIDCFVDGILENVEFYYNNGVLCGREIELIESNIKKNDVNAIISDFKRIVNKIIF